MRIPVSSFAASEPRRPAAACDGTAADARKPATFCFRAVIVCVSASVLALLPTATSSALAQRSPPATIPSVVSHPYAPHVAVAARRFDIPEAWIWAVMRVESGGNARAVSRAGAIGLMQIMPATWADLRARHGLGADPFDVRDNILAGAAYLREMYDRYGSASAMLAAYNAGPGRYDAYLSHGRQLPAETVVYLAKLSPVVGGGTVSGTVAIAPSDPLAWTRSALFTVRADNSTTTPNEAPARQPDDRLSVRDSRHAGTPEAPHALLFIALSGRVQP